MQQVIIFGQASQTEIQKIQLQAEDLDKTILEFLQDNNIPVASSCMGEGVCKKCVINENILSCFKLVRDILEWESPTIYISYL
ncbi:2Fe-2S iron-sulfur cluster-binding protein [Halobacteriovorax sp.]|uniref:2Fe-2S iron-sulfur cluster-binding protein n=1 Tax=Halobacteriovorax sp. TaxID=2020862 RepID=UPI003563FA4A